MLSKELQIGLLTKANVQGHGLGQKIIDGKPTDKLARVVYVTKKEPLVMLRLTDRVPPEIDGLPTDVQEVGEIKALGVLDPEYTPHASSIDRTARHRPSPCGVSIGHHAITAGTQGAIVADEQDHRRLILSNNHVLANSNDAALGDSIVQPGPHDGGDLDDAIATLERFVELKFLDMADCQIAKAIANRLNGLAQFLGSKHYFRVHNSQIEFNQVDAACALPLDESWINAYQLELGEVQGVNLSPAVGDQITKSGRTTAVTVGNIQAVHVTIQVSYGGSLVAVFEEQIMAGAMSAGGDSGSLVLDQNMNAIGLLFAGSDTTTIINPIGAVMDQLKVNI